MEAEALKKLKLLKIKFIQYSFNANYNFVKNFISLIKIFFFIKRCKPNILHSASPIANFFATIIIRFYSKPKLILSISGMGYLYTASINTLYNFKKNVLDFIFINFLNKIDKKFIIVQNKDDYRYFKKILSLDQNNLFLIKGGSGVEPRYFKKIKIIKKNKNVLMLSRIVKSKGVYEYFEAAKLLKKKYQDWNFNLAGPLDYLSPDKIDNNYFNFFLKNKIINFLGFSKDALKIYRNSEIFCLPSYREGMPKTILEASAVGMPIVTTNTIGCKESIVKNKNGFLCKKKNFKDLANKIEILIKDQKLRNQMKNFSKRYALKNYTIKIVTDHIFRIYEK